MTKKARSLSAAPRNTESRYVPSDTAAGRNATISESVALMTVIG
jgi:hypothetical protein